MTPKPKARKPAAKRPKADGWAGFNSRGQVLAWAVAYTRREVSKVLNGGISNDHWKRTGSRIARVRIVEAAPCRWAFTNSCGGAGVSTECGARCVMQNGFTYCPYCGREIQEVAK